MLKDQIEGQMTIFDFLDTPSSKMSPEHSQAMAGKISDVCLKSSAKSKTKMPLFLDLRGGQSGQIADASWEKGIPWLGESIMLNIMGYHSEEEDYVFSLISKETQQEEWFLNCGEKPLIPNPTKLSQILEDAEEKYRMSATACKGILSRAERRGKILPPLLKTALEMQSVSKNEQDAPGGGKGILIQNERTGTISTVNNQAVCTDKKVYGLSSYESNAMKSSNPNSGCYEADSARTLDNNGGNPACNQGGMLIVEGDKLGVDVYNQTITGDKTMSMTGAATDSHHIPCVLEGGLK